MWGRENLTAIQNLFINIPDRGNRIRIRPPFCNFPCFLGPRNTWQDIELLCYYIYCLHAYGLISDIHCIFYTKIIIKNGQFVVLDVFLLG